MSLQVIEKLKTDGVIVTLSSDHKINVTGDQSKVDYWLPEIAQHKQEIIDQLSNQESDLEKIRTWLFKIGEPEEDHFLVLDRCKNDLVALAYFLRHARGEFG
jgi:hypothetical protein